MKSLHSLRKLCSLALALALLCGMAMEGAPLAAAGGSVASTATPSNPTPSIGQPVVVTIGIDMSGASAPDDKLGSFSGTLEWDPAVLSHHSNSGMLAGFTGVVNTSRVATGHLSFTGANVTGAAGNIAALTITFDAMGAGTSALNLEYSAMAAATSFTNLLPILTVTDGQVVVSPAAEHYRYLPLVGKIR